MEKRTFIKSLNDAVDGFVHVAKNERNMRIHFLVGFLVLLVGILLGVSRIEWIILCVTVCLVLIAEMINTVVENVLDFIEASFHPDVRIIKDMAAGFVLISVINALIIGFMIFSDYWSWPIEFVAFKIRYSDWHIAFFSLLMVIFFVIGGKVYFHRGTPLMGGIVSGHSAVAFSLWAAVLFTQTNAFVIAAAFILALLVAQSRLRAKIHTLWEVVAGSALGFLVTALFFKLFR